MQRCLFSACHWYIGFMTHDVGKQAPGAAWTMPRDTEEVTGHCVHGILQKTTWTQVLASTLMFPLASTRP